MVSLMVILDDIILHVEEEQEYMLGQTDDWQISAGGDRMNPAL